MRFSFEVEYMPGKDLVIVNALSRAPFRGKRTVNFLLVEGVSSFVAGSLSDVSVTDSIGLVAKDQARDENCQPIVRYTRKGWPSLAFLLAALKPYWQERATFSVRKCVLKTSCLLVPQAL